MLNMSGVHICRKFDFIISFHFWIFFLKKKNKKKVMFGLFFESRTMIYIYKKLK